MCVVEQFPPVTPAARPITRADCTAVWLLPGLAADEYRLALGAEPTEGVLEKEDFFLVTFDYYTALGKGYMRSLYMDLLLT
eukprot:COSAG02_NODE_478_length_21511_cov_120.811087_6_plen_81_part_00